MLINFLIGDLQITSHTLNALKEDDANNGAKKALIHVFIILMIKVKLSRGSFVFFHLGGGYILTPREIFGIIKSMPGRKIPLVTDYFYHAYNRGIDRRPTFTSNIEYQRALDALWFYQFQDPPVKLSRFLVMGMDQQKKLKKAIFDFPQIVQVLSYCFMPNHFHFLLKQTKDNGISKFLSQFQNSYTRFFNTKHERTGPLFNNQFKAVLIETEEQLVHVSRYIHLNPFTSAIVGNVKELSKYYWSSYLEYVDQRGFVCDKEVVMAGFKNSRAYQQFVIDNADYQKKLESIKHLLIENTEVS